MSTSEATAGAAGGYNTADAHRLDITHIIYTSICDSSTKLGCRKPPLYSSSRDLLANYSPPHVESRDPRLDIDDLRRFPVVEFEE